jgi:hypothetical protein
MTLQAQRLVSETVGLIGGRASITGQHTIMLVPEDGDAVFLGRYDLAELLRKVAGSDHAALTVLASVMRNGHRFTDDPAPTGEEEPF